MPLVNQGWAYVSSSTAGGGGTPGGANTQVQYNDGGSFGGSADLTWDGTQLTTTNITASSNISASHFYGDGSNLTGITASAVEVADGPEYSLQFRYDTPVSGDLSGSANLTWNTSSLDLVVTGNVRLQEDYEFYGDIEGAVRFPAQVDEVGGITKGQVVYINGISGQIPTVGLAACDDASKMPAFGLAGETAADGADLQIVTLGSIKSLNLTALYDQTFAVGDVVYVQTGSGGNAGKLTNVAPTGSGNLLQNMGKVVRDGGGGDGQIKVMNTGRTNATPNLDKGYLFVGNDTNQSVQDNTVFISSSANLVGINNTNPDHTLTVGGDISGSGNISGSNFYTDNYLYADRAYLGTTGAGFIVSRTDGGTFMKMQTVGGNNSISFTLGGTKLVDILENGVDQVSLGATSGDVIYISGSLTASAGMRVSASAADITVGSGSSRTISVLEDDGDDFFVIGNDAGIVALSASFGVEFLADPAEGVGAFGCPIKVYTDQLGLTASIELSTSGDISGSGNISGSGLYAENVFVSSVPADRVLVSTSNGKVTSHSPFTFSSDVLSVPTITASVGIQTEAFEVSSSGNGSIGIGEGIIYTYGGLDRIDAFEDTFKLRDVNYYKAISTVQTTNFNIQGFQTFPVDTTGSVITGTLPGLTEDSQIGLTYTIKDFAGSGSTNNVVIEPSGSQQIDGGTAAKIQTNYGALTLTAFSSSGGYSWGIVSTT